MPIKQRCLGLAVALAIGAAHAQMGTPPPSVPPAAQPLKAPTRPAAPLPPRAGSPGFSSNAGETSAASQEGYPGPAQVVVPLQRTPAAPPSERASVAPPAPAAQPRATAKPCRQLATRSERSACRKAAAAKSPA